LGLEFQCSKEDVTVSTQHSATYTTSLTVQHHDDDKSCVLVAQRLGRQTFVVGSIPGRGVMRVMRASRTTQPSIPPG